MPVERRGARLLLVVLALSYPAWKADTAGEERQEGEVAPWRDGPHNLYRMLSRPDDVCLERDWEAFQFSSRDPAGGQQDFNHYLREEGSRKILAEVEGPGAIARMWFTGSRFMYRNVLRVEIDGEPVIETSIGELTAGDRFPFVPPLVGKGSGGGSFCYVPLPFRESCRVSLELKDSAIVYHYYQIQGMRFPDDSGVNPFRLPLQPEDSRSVERAVADWSGEPYSLKTFHALPEPVGKEQPLLSCSGSGVIHQIQIDYWPERARSLGETSLKISDGDNTLVDCPLTALLGLLPGSSPYRSRFIEAREGVLRFLWPIVHYDSIHVVLTGNTDPIRGYGFEYQSLSAEDARQRGRLRVEHTVVRAGDQDAVELLDLAGKGHLAGVILRTRGVAESPANHLSYLEGDDSVQVDADEEGALLGTGLEDYFNGAFYFNGGVATFPNHGVAYYDVGEGASRESEIVAYRFAITDTVPFEVSLRMRWEIVPAWRERDLGFETVAFWYDFSECSPLQEWPDRYDWDLDRDSRVDARDVALYLGSLQGREPSLPSAVPWPFRLSRSWSLFQ